METTARALVDIIDNLESRLRQISESDAEKKPDPVKWSKKEILGHLIDSAGNNHQKFVRIMLAEKSIDFVGYEQDAWVNTQQYNKVKWQDIIAIWASYNRHLAHIIREVEPSKLENTIWIAGLGPYSLRFIMTDYVEHLKHHLQQILPNEGLESKFSMTPYV